MTFVSVIAPVYLAQDTLPRAVLSVINQSFSDWEMCVVSDDENNYQEYLNALGINDTRLRFFKTNKVESGPACARNLGLRESRGEVIAFLDADDLFFPTRLEKLCSVASETGVCVDNVSVFDETTQRFLPPPLPTSQGTTLTLSEYLKTTIPMSFVFRRDFVTVPFFEQIFFSEDTLFKLQAYNKSQSVTFVNETLWEYRIHNNSTSNSQDIGDTAGLNYQKILNILKNGKSGLNPVNIKEIVSAFEVKLFLNDRFILAKKQGCVLNFQEYIAREGLHF